jgi:hypothetical protein
MAGLALTDRREHREAMADLLDSVRASMSRRLVLRERSARERPRCSARATWRTTRATKPEDAVTDAVIARADADQMAATS